MLPSSYAPGWVEVLERVSTAPDSNMASGKIAKRSFDYLVIGGGSGGLGSARRAASLGATVGIIEHGRIGGTCVRNVYI